MRGGGWQWRGFEAQHTEYRIFSLSYLFRAPANKEVGRQGKRNDSTHFKCEKCYSSYTYENVSRKSDMNRRQIDSRGGVQPGEHNYARFAKATEQKFPLGRHLKCLNYWMQVSAE